MPYLLKQMTLSVCEGLRGPAWPLVEALSRYIINSFPHGPTYPVNPTGVYPPYGPTIDVPGLLEELNAAVREGEDGPSGAWHLVSALSVYIIGTGPRGPTGPIHRMGEREPDSGPSGQA